MYRIPVFRKNVFFFLPLLVLFSCASPPPVRVQEGSTENAAPVPAPVTGGETVPSPPAGTGGESVTAPPAAEAPLPEVSRPEVPQPDYLTIVAAGDNLYHSVMIKDGEQGDYEPVYAEIRNIAEKADIAFINQETLLAGKDFGFSSYPLFNTPQAVGRAVAAAGFTVVNQGNNHAMDKGEKAVAATMDFWDTVPGVTVLGVHRSEEAKNLPVLIKKNNITLGFLSYTYGTNGLPVPADKPWLVSLVNTKTMAEEIDALRPLCDFLVVSMHWGEEYQSTCSREQKRLAAFLAEHKVDLVLGHHPHVIQPVTFIPRPDGGSMLCFYSLGNLVSAQTQTLTLLGALAYVKLEKNHTLPSQTACSVVITAAGAIPLVTHYEKNYTGFKVYPLYAYTGELAGKHWKNQTKKELTVDYFTGLAAKVLGGREIMQNPFN